MNLKKKLIGNLFVIIKKISESFIEEHLEYIDFKDLSRYQKMSESFIEKYQDKLDWKELSYSRIFNINFLNKFKDKIDWKGVEYLFNNGYYHDKSYLTKEFLEKISKNDFHF